MIKINNLIKKIWYNSNQKNTSMSMMTNQKLGG